MKMRLTTAAAGLALVLALPCMADWNTSSDNMVNTAYYGTAREYRAVQSYPTRPRNEVDRFSRAFNHETNMASKRFNQNVNNFSKWFNGRLKIRNSDDSWK